MNKKLPVVNPELFKGVTPKQVEPKSYYAYIDTIEVSDGVANVRFDCLDKKLLDEVDVSEQSLLTFPSIILELSCPSIHLLKVLEMEKPSSLVRLESDWVILFTSLEETELPVTEFFNFNQVNNVEGNYYFISSVIKRNKLDSISTLKIEDLKKKLSLVESDKKQISDFIKEIRSEHISHVNVYDVGQGNCIALVDEQNMPVLYFDVGGGSGPNAATYPPKFRLCHTHFPPVILSHWDNDHIITAIYDPNLLNTKWLVPMQGSLSHTAYRVAYTLKIRGNLVVWNNTIGSELPMGPHYISKCFASPRYKNSSGLAIYFYLDAHGYILLPADATFKYIPNVSTRKLVGLVASHHGSRHSIAGMPKAPEKSMLAYSYGLGNTHGHPNPHAVGAYIRKNWTNSLMTVNGHIAMVHAPHYHAIPCHGRKCSLLTVQNY